MAKELPVLEAESREKAGKGPARTARRNGFVPAVIYGGDKAPESINVKFNELLKLLKRGGFKSTMYNVKVDGKDNRVICRDVQRDVVRDLPIHADFLRLTERSRINLMIPVKFINEGECPGVTKGGMLTVTRHEIELNVVAGDIPDEIEIDLTGLEMGDNISISKVTLPKGAKPTITDRDFAIATITAPRAVSDDDEGEGEEGEAAEGGDGEAAEGGEE